MSSGIEIAGVVLATLPLCIEIAKAYSNGVDTVLNVALKSKYDERLADFYDEFYWNISELDQNIEYVWIAAMGRSCDRPSTLDLTRWDNRPDIATNFRRFCRSDAAFHQYLLITKRIATLLVQLVADETTHMSHNNLEETQMFNELLQFANYRQSQTTSSTFIERFRFFKKTKDRDRCLRSLSKWNSRLQSLIESSQRPHPRNVTATICVPATSNNPWNSYVLRIKDPAAKVCLLTRDLYNVLRRSWNCNCGHEAKLCLNIHKPEKFFSDVEAEFGFLISWSSEERSDRAWREGIVGIKSSNCPSSNQESELDHMCEALSSCVSGLGLRLLMEDINGQQHLWRLDPKPNCIPVIETKPPESLQELLLGSAKIGAYEKRELAIISAYSLLLLHDTPWLRSRWNKTHLSFFHKAEDEPDFTRPFISTKFQNPAQQIGSPGSSVFHRNSLIFDLGILLIEIFNEKPIEVWRTVSEQTTVSSSTESMVNLLVADRVVRKMDMSLSRTAVEACLNLDWAPQGRAVELKDPEVRSGLFQNVILPLETEISMVV